MEKKSGPAFSKVPGSRLLAIMRRDREKAADYARRHEVPHWYSEVEALLEHPDINAVYIATPPDSHRRYALAALAAGKDVYLEKPMALNATEAAELVQAVADSGRKLVVAHYRRALPAFAQVKALLADAAIGRVLWADIHVLQAAKPDLIAASETNWRVEPAISGGGLFHDLAPHQLDLMLHYFGDPIAWQGFSANQQQASAADDVVSGQIRFEDEVLVRGLWHFGVPEALAGEGCVITGSRGQIQFSFFGTEVHLIQDGRSETFYFDPPEHAQQPMIERVVRYFQGEAPNPCSAAVGLQVMEIMDAMTGGRR
jgi:predicted dehydrogenase